MILTWWWPHPRLKRDSKDMIQRGGVMAFLWLSHILQWTWITWIHRRPKKHLFSWPCLLSSCQAFLTQTKSWEAESWKLFKDQPFVWPELLKGKGSESPCVLLSVLTEAQGHPFRFAAGKDPAASWRQDSGGIKPLPWRCLPPTWGRKWRRKKTCCFRGRVCYCQAVRCVYEKKVIKRERRPPTGPPALPSPPAPAHPEHRRVQEIWENEQTLQVWEMALVQHAFTGQGPRVGPPYPSRS